MVFFQDFQAIWRNSSTSPLGFSPGLIWKFFLEFLTNVCKSSLGVPLGVQKCPQEFHKNCSRCSARVLSRFPSNSYWRMSRGIPGRYSLRISRLTPWKLLELFPWCSWIIPGDFLKNFPGNSWRNSRRTPERFFGNLFEELTRNSEKQIPGELL